MRSLVVDAVVCSTLPSSTTNNRSWYSPSRTRTSRGSRWRSVADWSIRRSTAGSTPSNSGNPATCLASASSVQPDPAMFGPTWSGISWSAATSSTFSLL